MLGTVLVATGDTMVSERNATWVLAEPIEW